MTSSVAAHCETSVAVAAVVVETERGSFARDDGGGGETDEREDSGPDGDSLTTPGADGKLILSGRCSPKAWRCTNGRRH
jgi:hypothetical protein